MDRINIYSLSNSSSVVHFEKDIQNTELGKLFNQKISERLGFEVVTSFLTVNKSAVCIDIKQKGREGGVFGTVFRKTENSMHNISDPTCKLVLDTLCECIDTLSLKQIDITNKLLSVEIYDFVKRSRVGYFMERTDHLEKKLKAKYQDLSFSLRFKDDDQYYYLIFSTDEDMRKAKEKYGIENINNYVWELCRQEDTYHVFDLPLPEPVISTRQEIINSGAAMGIMRNNPNFTTL